MFFLFCFLNKANKYICNVAVARSGRGGGRGGGGGAGDDGEGAGGLNSTDDVSWHGLAPSVTPVTLVYFQFR